MEVKAAKKERLEKYDEKVFEADDMYLDIIKAKLAFIEHG
jgi:hypothetical protein